jgi:hypothetical protein
LNYLNLVATRSIAVANLLLCLTLLTALPASAGEEDGATGYRSIEGPLTHQNLYHTLEKAYAGHTDIMPEELTLKLTSSAQNSALRSIEQFIAGRVDQATLFRLCDNYFQLLDSSVERFRPAGLPIDHKRLLGFMETPLARIVKAIDERAVVTSSLKQALVQQESWPRIEGSSDQQSRLWPKHPLSQMILVESLLQSGSANLIPSLTSDLLENFEQFSRTFQDRLSAEYRESFVRVGDNYNVGSEIYHASSYRYYQYEHLKCEFFILQFKLLRSLQGIELTEDDNMLFAEIMKLADSLLIQLEIIRAPYDRWFTRIGERALSTPRKVWR